MPSSHKRHRTFQILTATVLSGLLSNANMHAGELDDSGNAVRGNPTKTAPLVEKKTESPVTDQHARKAAEFARQLKTLLDRPPNDLVRLARRLSREVDASLAHGSEIARLEQREHNLSDALDRANRRNDSARSTHSSLKKSLHTRMQDVADRYGENPAERDRQQLALLAYFESQLLRQKEIVEFSDREIDEVGNQLGRLRADLSELRLQETIAAEERIPADIRQLSGVHTILPRGTQVSHKQNGRTPTADDVAARLKALTTSTDLPPALSDDPLRSENSAETREDQKESIPESAVRP